MRVFGLIGYPLSHSFSKKFFTDKFRTESIKECVYENFEIPSINDLTNLVEHTPYLSGLNVTIPYKESVIPFLHWKSEVVEKTGACNCIKIQAGQLYGFNTDTTGFELSVKEKLLPHHRKALVLGTGGAAKAINYVLEKLQIDHWYVGRNKKEDSVHSMRYEEITDDILQSHTLIINTTPLGMYPDMNMAPSINYELLSSKHFLFDVIYNPEKTLFLKRGEEKGASIKNGYDMLIIQAEESWKIWNDVLPAPGS